MANATAAPEMILFSKQDLAAHLRLSVNHVDYMERNNAIPPSFKLGSKKRWKSEVILRWIDAGCPPVDENGQFKSVGDTAAAK